MTTLTRSDTAAAPSVDADAVLLLGHGSKAPEANATLRRVAEEVKARGGYPEVKAGFLQIEPPSIAEAVDDLVSRGAKNIVVMPYFLYMGLHVTKDLPREIDAAREKHPGVTFSLAANLGFHSSLVDITMERIEELASSAPSASASSPGQHPIEAESFSIIEDELEGRDLPFSGSELPVLKRVIHTTADFDYVDTLRFSPGAMAAGMGAVSGGSPIVTDVRMVDSGITRGRLRPFGCEVVCLTSEPATSRLASRDGTTRTAAAMRRAAPFMKGGIVAVGNAPTALNELMRLIESGEAEPALVVGVPVGFVGAEEAKEALMNSGVEHITVAGRKGGSTVAAAIVNAVIIEAAAAAASGA